MEIDDPWSCLAADTSGQLRPIIVSGQRALRKALGNRGPGLLRFDARDLPFGRTELELFGAIRDFAERAFRVLVAPQFDRQHDDFDSFRNELGFSGGVATTTLNLAHQLFRHVIGRPMGLLWELALEGALGMVSAEIEDEWQDRAALRESGEQSAHGGDTSDPHADAAPRQLILPPALTRAPLTKTAALIEAFRVRIWEETGRRIPKTAIWRVAGYTNRTEFERYQREDKKISPTTRAAFDRVLKLAAHDFLSKLEKLPYRDFT